MPKSVVKSLIELVFMLTVGFFSVTSLGWGYGIFITVTATFLYGIIKVRTKMNLMKTAGGIAKAVGNPVA